MAEGSVFRSRRISGWYWQSEGLPEVSCGGKKFDAIAQLNRR
ncbi:hypothetical protein [Coleofasciculus sp. FACHB-1120]|nr:hypothetical protein [Coleofasciculus sp. FACHB-1120]